MRGHFAVLALHLAKTHMTRKRNRYVILKHIVLLWVPVSAYSFARPFVCCDRARASAGFQRDCTRTQLHATLQEILQELDDRNIRYSPVDTREELLRKLQRAKTSPSASTMRHVDVSNLRSAAVEDDQKSKESSSRSSPESGLRQQRRSPPPVEPATSPRRGKRRRRRQRLQMEQRPAWMKVTDQAKSVATRKASGVWDRASRKARKVARKASEIYHTDKDGIRDVKVEYVSRDEDILKRQQRQRQRTATTRPKQPASLSIPSAMPQASPHPSGTQGSKQRPAGSDKTVKRKKAIYSPYAESKVDLFGQFRGKRSMSVKESDDATASCSNESPRREKDERQHWKDRLEERFDTMLGIHEDGNYYTSWMKREKEEGRKEEGYDAVSVARGRRPKRRHEAVKRPTYEKPFWEEEGSIFALLLGNTSNGGSMVFDKLLDMDTGALVGLFKALSRLFLLVGSYLCRWASVRGALPQPVVVVGLCTAGVCARRKLRAVGIALIAMRTIGELIHGSMYDSEDWHDAEDYLGSDDPPEEISPAFGAS